MHRRNSVIQIHNSFGIDKSESLHTGYLSSTAIWESKYVNLPPGRERYSGLEGLRKYCTLSIVIWRKGEAPSKAYAMIYSRLYSDLNCIRGVTQPLCGHSIYS